ncbi:uncharacterized protein [Montipora capricornis]|uniref:uncharacterized protein n=1 Tax=Montipora capricornis TaxID=246305 RepID=UPI0035F11975
MVNDLVNTWSKRAKYVDDLTILEIIPRNSPSYLNCIVDDIQCFSHCNNMRLNPAKCKAMTIDFLDYNSCTWRPICTGGVVIERVKSFKLLGVYISEDLPWGVHCDYIIKKANRRLYALRSLKKCGVPTSDLITVYCSLIRSVIEYASAIFANLPKYLSDALQGIQKRALRIILSNLHYDEALTLSGLLSSEDRRAAACESFMPSAMSSSRVTPSTLASFSSLSAMPSLPVTPSTLASFFSLSAMSSSPVTPSTLASFSSLPSTSTPPVTPATISPASSPSTLPVTPATKPPECSDYKFLNDPSIAATYRRDGLYHVCKDNFKPGWHRFGGEAGNQMADTCVKMCHCGVVYPGWLSGGHPSVEDGAVVRRVCFGRGCTCDTFVYISVRNCSGFYVYNLTSIPSSYCYYGYCASTGFEEPTSSATERSKQRFLNGTNGIILFYTYYQECMYPHYSWQIAARKGEKVKLEVQYMDVSAWNGSCTLGYVEIQNGTYADGKPITRMCSYLLSGIETFYSHEGQSVGVHVEVANMDLYGWWWIYFEATYTVISYNDTVSNECYNYGFLNESNRAMTYVNRSNGNLCDSTLSGWYRFSGEAGTQMADSCPKIHHCSTDSPGWLSGTHPTVAEGIVQRKVCFLQHLNGTDCCYFSKNISVRNCGAFYVYRLDPPRCYSRYCGNGLPQAPECSNYRFLNDSSIAATYTLYEQSYHSCTNNFKPGWHRFDGEAGNQMADTCVKMCHCGAWHPGWLTGGHPSVEDGTVVRKVCFAGSLGCCKASVYISVRNCTGFYVYNLTSIPSSSCYYGYCASTGFKEPTTSEFSKQRLLNGTIGTGSFYLYYHGCPYPHYSWQIVAKKGEKVKLEIQYISSYWWGGSCTLGYLEIQNGTYADGKPTNTRTCGYLLSGIITFYSHAGQSLEVVVSNVDLYWSWMYFTATYTVISYNDTVSNGKHTQVNLQSQ